MAVRVDDVDLARDTALVDRFQAGDAGAFDELYRRYFPRLRRTCARNLGDIHEGEEVAQEAFARAYRALPRLGDERRFYPWVRVIASNLCADVHRRRTRTRPTAAVADHGADEAAFDSVTDDEDRAHVRAALARVTPRQREALELWAAGRPSREIADHLGCRVGAVDVTLHRARRSLRRHFTAIAGDAVGAVVVAIAAFASRLRRLSHRMSARLAATTDIWTPLAAKAAAVAIAAGALSSGTSPRAVVPASAASTPAPATAPEPTAAPLPDAPAAPVTGRRHEAAPATGAGQVAGVARPGAFVPPSPPGGRFMTADEADRAGASAPIHVDVGGTMVAANPDRASAALNDRVTSLGRKP